MQTEKVTLWVTLLALGALVPRRFAGFGGTMCAAGERALGVPRYAGAVGDQVAVGARGEIVVEAGAAVAVGDEVQSDATSRAVKLSTGVANGVARDAATAAGDLIRVLV
ncbi:capsid cement protein [Rhodoferax sp. BLA1]|uniref:capsid cement protein n=1 Tax=Rhodoferax sp. BLA1 TaxID=2576062 RepID=UPI0015D2A4F3|nr:capsid cement protein [Rhodoferax sp. BLA1]